MSTRVGMTIDLQTVQLSTLIDALVGVTKPSGHASHTLFGSALSL